jgi:hypothetical protein
MNALGGLLRRPFLVVFAALLVAAFAVAMSHRMGPGQDFHYHAFAARVAALGWKGDPVYSAIYAKVNPLDANTLLYTLSFPVEMLTSPLTANRIVMAVFYFVGYPAACAGALVLLGRSPWGAVLAVPLAYNSAWVSGGFMPMCLAAPLFVLSVALLARAIEAPQRRRRLALSAIVVALLFLAHAHVYAWTIALFALFTIATIAGRLLVGAARGFELAARECVRLTGRMLVIVAPSLALATWWWVRARGGGDAVPTKFSDESIHVHVASAHTFLAMTKSRWEFFLVGMFVVVVLAGIFFAGRPKRAKAPLPEIAVLMSIVSYVVLPWSMNDQGLAPRQIDMALWLLPLVVYPYAATRDALVRHLAVVALFLAFATARLAVVGTYLRALDREYAGFFDLASQCPPKKTSDGKVTALAYATSDIFTPSLWAGSFHQPYATLAAMCGIDAPVRDTRKYPYNKIPLRYRDAPPAPPTIVIGDAKWFEAPGLWESFEYVLVRAAPPAPADLADVHASSGEWTVYRRKKKR